MTRFVPAVAFVAMVALFAVMMLSDRNPKEINSVLIGRTVPDFALPTLDGGTAGDAVLKARGKPVLVNFFASWCVPCRAEHQTLMDLAARGDLVMVGIAYKDRPGDTRAFLDELGNPFEVVLRDETGDVAIEFGVSGAPETFLIDRDGTIRYRHWGPMVGDTIAQRLAPELEALGLP